MRPLWFFCTLVLFCSASFAADENTTIVRTGAISEDTYLAGERIKIDASVDGDLILAAADVVVAGSVSGDLMAAGAKISISAELADDVRAAGGDLSICTKVAGDAVLAGGNIDICSSSIIGEKAWIAGGNITVDGRIEKDLTIRASKVRLAGVFLRDVNIEAKSIEILENTEIMGDLIYTSPDPAYIHEGANIVGEEDYTLADTWWNDNSGELSISAMFKIGIGLFLLVVLSTVLTAYTLSSFLPETFTNADRIIRTQFLQSLATGLLLTLVFPVLLVLLGVTVIAIPLAWIGLLLYLILLAIGGYTGLLFIADTVFQAFKRDKAHSKTSRLLSILVATLLLLIVSFIPLIGAVAILIIYLTGVGALCRTLNEYRKQHKLGSALPEEQNS